MKELDIDQQLLIITMEECGELIQECSKLLRKNTIDQKDLDNLKKELGDVQTMINLWHEHDHVSFEEIDNREQTKRNKLEVWSDLISLRDTKQEELSEMYENRVFESYETYP